MKKANISSVNRQVEGQAIVEMIINMEKAALAEWYKGNPTSYLEIYDGDDFTYFDPSRESRVDGFEAIKGIYEGIKGTVFADDYEMLNPVVQASSDMAVLTYNLRAQVDDKMIKWNCTEVYRLQADRTWKIIHSHWGFIRPMDMAFDSGKEIV